jgi:hypothetical protein
VVSEPGAELAAQADLQIARGSLAAWQVGEKCCQGGELDGIADDVSCRSAENLHGMVDCHNS